MTSPIKGVIVVGYETLSRCLFSLPRFRSLNYLKGLWLRMAGARVGRRVTFYPGVWIMTGRGLTIGDDVDLALDVMVTTDGGVTIGDRVLVGYRTVILSSNHRIPEGGGRIFGSGHVKKPVVIGADSWLGANCIVLAGVTIGRSCVIGAGSVVTKSIPDSSIAVGNPARVIRSRT